jgi:Type II secretion system (T2SS), protein M
VSLTDRDRKIVMAIVPLLLIVVYWFLVLSPKRKDATKLSGEVTQAQQARDTAVSEANALEQAKSSFATQYAEMVRLGKAIPTVVDMPSLLVQLNAAAHGTGIQFGDIKVGARVPAAPLESPSSGGSAGAAGTTGPTGAQPPVAAGGVPAQSTFGKAAESANNAAATGNAQAVQQSGLNPGDTATSTSSGSGLPVGGGSAAAAISAAPGAAVPGLDTVPLTFTFGGKFFHLSDFFHRLKRFVHVANNKISVQGRLITVNSLKFTTTAANFPNIEADVTATVYLSPKDGGTTAGATSQGPAAATPGSTTPSSQPATAAIAPPTAAATR